MEGLPDEYTFSNIGWSSSEETIAAPNEKEKEQEKEQEQEKDIEKEQVKDDSKPASKYVVSSRLGVHYHVDPSHVDKGAHLDVDFSKKLEPHEALRIKQRIDSHLLPLMCSLYILQFVDRNTVTAAGKLGLTEALNLTEVQNTWLGAAFWIAYLTFQFPQALALQKFHIGHWLSFNIFIWSVALGASAACRNFASLVIIRIIMGICQSTIPAGFLIINTSFYMRPEQPVRVGYWFSMSGVSVIVLNFIAYGCSYIPSTLLEPWQWLMIITSFLTFILAPLYWFYFPDSPTTAWFLSPADRELALIRIKGNQTGVGNMLFKWPQFRDLIQDPKTWFFALLGALTQIPTSLTTQREVIVAQLNLKNLSATVINSIEGLFQFISIIAAVKFAVRFNNNRAFTGALWAVPGIAGAALLASISLDHPVGLLFSYWLSIWVVACYPVMLGWMSSTTAGHTKRVLTNATVFSAFGIGNALGPQMWQPQYRPMNEIPFSIIVAFEFAFAAVFLIMRVYLNSENVRREAEMTDEQYDNVYIKQTQLNGVQTSKKVEKFLLDLTDRQNRDFRYVL